MGSIALMVNNVISPGMVALPLVYQQAGWLVPTLSMLFAFLASSFACVMLAEAMQRAPGNHRFGHRLEYCDVVAHYMGNRGYGSRATWELIAVLFYNISLTCMNVGSIIIMAQTADQILLFLFSQSFALELYPHLGFMTETATRLAADTLPFATDLHGAPNPVVLTLGYLLSAVVFLPLGFMTLEENVFFQFFAFVVFIALTLLFIGVFSADMHPGQLPLMGDHLGQGFSVVMFCFSYAIAIPSWVNEKRPDVGIAGTVWWSALPSTLLQVLFGAAGALAYANVSDNVLLDLVAHQAAGAWATSVRLAVFVFTVLVMGMGIPLFHIFVRYNLFSSGLCSPAAANFWGVAFPWLVSWALYGGNLYQQFLNYSSLLSTSLTCYLFPIGVFTLAVSLRSSADGYAAVPNDGAATSPGPESPDGVPASFDEPAFDTVQSVPRWLGPPRRFAVGLLGVTGLSLLAAAVCQAA
eukprot:EG_transcript_9990